jgi:F-type H+-transporting ATPase subunit delta
MINVQEYGKALFELAVESNNVKKTHEDVTLVRDALEANPEYAKLLDNPAISREERTALIDKAFSGVGEYVANLVKMMADGHVSYLFPKVAETYSALYDEMLGIERVEAICAVALTDAQKKTLIAKLEHITGKTVVLTVTVDRSILGGMKLRYGSCQLDGSVKTRLDTLARSLSSAVI